MGERKGVRMGSLAWVERGRGMVEGMVVVVVVVVKRKSVVVGSMKVLRTE